MSVRHGIGVQEALDLAHGLAPALPGEPVAVPEAAGRVLAEDVRAGRDLPAQAGSAMDGWAVRAADTPGPLRTTGESAAGSPAGVALGSGCAIAISTGASLPEGADAVARREIARLDGTTVVVTEAVAPGRDVRRRGETIREGELLLGRGHRVAPHEVGALGATGRAEVLCARRPRVAILATGAELVALGATAGPAEVHDSSRHGLAAQAVAAGALVVASVTVGDDLEDTVAALAGLLDGSGDLRPDIVITNGGISAGDHDLVRPALQRLGVEEVARGVRARPVHPTYLGRRGDQVVLGLPGNPASAAVAFHLLGRPLLGARNDWWHRAPLTAAADTRPGRAELVRCVEGPEGLTPRPDQGPHAVTSLAGATALAWVGEDEDGAAGSLVRFSRLA
jgi:molybdopterin molybdotransferase